MFNTINIIVLFQITVLNSKSLFVDINSTEPTKYGLCNARYHVR